MKTSLPYMENTPRLLWEDQVFMVQGMQESPQFMMLEAVLYHLSILGEQVQNAYSCLTGFTLVEVTGKGVSQGWQQNAVNHFLLFRVYKGQILFTYLASVAMATDREMVTNEGASFILDDISFKSDNILQPRVDNLMKEVTDLKHSPASKAKIFEIIGTLAWLKEKCARFFCIWGEFGTSE